jgi:peroxiredoxin
MAEAWQRIEASELPLARKLDAYASETRTLAPALLAAYDRMVGRIAGNGAAQLSPGVGDRMPDFLFADAAGHLVALSALWRQAPLAVVFNRGHWCPYCRLQLRALARAARDIEAAGGHVVSLVPETQGFARQMIAASSLPFPVLLDLDLSYALLNGLVFSVGDEIREAYLERGLDLPRFQGNGAWLLPISATFVVATDGRVVARFIDPDFRRRMPVEDIVAAVALAKSTGSTSS